MEACQLQDSMDFETVSDFLAPVLRSRNAAGAAVWVQKIWTQVCMERDLQQHERVQRTAWCSVIRMTFKCSWVIKVLHNRRLTHCSLTLLIVHPASGVIMDTVRMKCGDDARTHLLGLQHTLTVTLLYPFLSVVGEERLYVRDRWPSGPGHCTEVGLSRNTVRRWLDIKVFIHQCFPLFLGIFLFLVKIINKIIKTLVKFKNILN